MRRLICAFVVRIWHKTHFLMARLIYILQTADDGVIFRLPALDRPDRVSFNGDIFESLPRDNETGEWPSSLDFATANHGDWIYDDDGFVNVAGEKLVLKHHWSLIGYKPAHDKTNKMSLGPAKTQISPADQPGHPPSLIRVLAVCMKKPWVLRYQLHAQWWL